MMSERDEITNEIHVAGRQARRRDGYWWLIMILTAAGFAATSASFAWHNTNETELKFCKLVTASVERAESRVESYEETPPSTEAGRAQQLQAASDVAILSDLLRSLGCPTR